MAKKTKKTATQAPAGMFTTQHRKMGSGTPISGAQFGGK